jgi:hypothetical protein
MGYSFRTFQIWVFDIVSNLACQREAAPAKEGIPCLEFNLLCAPSPFPLPAEEREG